MFCWIWQLNFVASASEFMYCFAVVSLLTLLLHCDSLLLSARTNKTLWRPEKFFGIFPNHLYNSRLRVVRIHPVALSISQSDWAESKSGAAIYILLPR